MRNYKRTTNYVAITEGMLKQAKELMARGVSQRQAAKAIGVDESSLRRKLKAFNLGANISNKLGRYRHVLAKEEEDELVQHCKELDKRFFGLTLRSLRSMIFQYCEKNNKEHRFSKQTKLAGRDYVRQFMKRNKLSLRSPRKISTARAMAFNRVQVNQFFENLEHLYLKYQFTADRIYNMDETGVQTVPNKVPKHVAPTGKKDVAKSVAADQGQTVTVVCAMSASGHHIPPYFIYKRKKPQKLLIKNGPVGCDYYYTEKGYMNTTTFPKWLSHFQKFANATQERPILLVLDNHISHINLAAVTSARECNIHLVTLPPHCSHKMQPLDRSFFRPFKAYYDDAADNWTSSHPGEGLSVYDVAEIVSKAFQKAATVEKAVNGFRVCGIVPLDKNVFTDSDFLPSEVTHQDEESNDENEDENMLVAFENIDSEPSRAEALDLDGTREIDTRILAVTPKKVPTTNCDVSQPGPSSAVSPSDIIPLPKMEVKRKRTRKGLKSTWLTSSPHKRLLLELEKQKIEMETAKEKRKEERVKKQQRKNNVKPAASPTTSDLEEEEGISLYDSSGGSEFVSDEEIDEGCDLNQGDFALVKVPVKLSTFRMFVCKILEVTPNGYDVLFFKRAPKTLKFQETAEEACVLKEDIVLKLSKPVVASSARFLNMISFANDLSNYTIY